MRDLARFGMVFTPSSKKIAGEQVIPDAIMKKIYDSTYVAMYDKGWAGKKFAEPFYDDAGKTSNRYQWDAVLSDGDLFNLASAGRASTFPSPRTRSWHGSAPAMAIIRKKPWRVRS